MLRSPSSARCWWRWWRSMGAPPRRRRCRPERDLGRPSGDPLRDARAAVRAAPDSVDARALLGEAYVTKARATGDPSIYARADRVLSTALRRDPRNLAALVGAGTLAGLRHDFREQLRLGLEARRVAPRPRAPVRRHRRRADRARPVPGRRPLDPAARGPQAGPPRVRARVLLPRAHRRPGRCGPCDALRRLRRRRPGEPRVRAGADRQPRAVPWAPARRQGCLPRLASNRARLLGRAGGTRARGRGARRPAHGRRAPAPPRRRPAARSGTGVPRGARARAGPSGSCARSPQGGARAVRPRPRRRRSAGRRGRALRGEPRKRCTSGAPRPPRMARKAEHPLRGRARLGAHASGAPA